ncbi:MAG: hypothetical protein V1672_03575 [Candidatus Diapherotrites archaeon]
MGFGRTIRNRLKLGDKVARDGGLGKIFSALEHEETKASEHLETLDELEQQMRRELQIMEAKNETMHEIIGEASNFAEKIVNGEYNIKEGDDASRIIGHVANQIIRISRPRWWFFGGVRFRSFDSAFNYVRRRLKKRTINLFERIVTAEEAQRREHELYILYLSDILLASEEFKESIRKRFV